MRELLNQPLIRVLIIATTVAMCSLALRETASVTLPVITALKEVLIPVAIGFTIAYVLTPLVDWMTNRLRIPRSISAGLFFGFFSLLLTLTMMLVVPTVIRQSTNMAERIFKGEQFDDINSNGKFDPGDGERYVDANGNGQYDATGMFANALKWIEERQSQLREFAKLELGKQSLSFLNLYIDETASERGLIDAAMATVRDNRPVEEWPEQLRRDPLQGGPLTWEPNWPGISREQFDEALNRLPQDVRDRWKRNLSAAGQSYATKHALLLSALRLVNNPQKVEESIQVTEAIARVREALKAARDEEREKQSRQFAQRLSDDALRGQIAARDLMAELRGDDSSSQWLAPVVQQLETEVNTQLDTLPKQIGSWAKSSLNNISDVLAFGLDVILVPIYSFFLILAMPAIRKGVRTHLPEWNRAQLIRILHDIEKVVAAFFRGRLIVCLICATLTYLGFLAVGLTGTGVPYAALFGLFIGLATAVPLAGLLFLVPAVIMAGLDGGSGLTITLIILVYTVVQVLETVVLTPTIMGHEVELHPVTLIIALLLCGKLLGILGLILAVPIAATGRILAREFFFPWLTGYVTKIRPALKTPFDET